MILKCIKDTYTVISKKEIAKKVYFIATNSLGEKFFIKGSSDIEEIELFKKEASYLKYLNFDYYVEFIKIEDMVYLILKYIDGKKLNECKFASTLEKLKMFSKILDKVDYIHKKGIIHGDLKPSNILIGNDVSIIDFNSSELINSKKVSNYATIHYASLEHLMKVPLEVSSDIYSLGIIFFELITEHRLFLNCDSYKIKAIKLFGISDLISSYGNYYRDFDNVFRKCTFYDKKMRYQSIKELKGDIERIILLTSNSLPNSNNKLKN